MNHHTYDARCTAGGVSGRARALRSQWRAGTALDSSGKSQHALAWTALLGSELFADRVEAEERDHLLHILAYWLIGVLFPRLNHRDRNPYSRSNLRL